MIVAVSIVTGKENCTCGYHVFVSLLSVFRKSYESQKEAKYDCIMDDCVVEIMRMSEYSSMLSCHGSLVLEITVYYDKTSVHDSNACYSKCASTCQTRALNNLLVARGLRRALCRLFPKFHVTVNYTSQ